MTLCVCGAGAHGPGVQDPARTHQEAPGGAFWFQLARRLTGVHPDVLEALALERPQWRTDRLLELGADLSDCLERYEAGGVGEAPSAAPPWTWPERRRACGRRRAGCPWTPGGGAR